MGEIRVTEIKDGDILEQTVHNQSGEIIIAKGTELRQEYGSLLRSLGIETIRIEANGKSMHSANEEVYQWVDELRSIIEKHIYQGKNSLKKLEGLAEQILLFMTQEQEENLESYDILLGEKNIYNHIIQVTIACAKIAKRIDMTQEEQKVVIIGGLLHDLGLRYVTIPYVELDLEQLSAQDIFEYKKHTIFGFTALESENWVPEKSRKMVLSHHERMDGSGFPLKQKNKEIECQIIQVVDQYFCKVNGIGCISQKEELVQNVLKKMAGIQYNDEIVSIFMGMLGTNA